MRVSIKAAFHSTTRFDSQGELINEETGRPLGGSVTAGHAQKEQREAAQRKIDICLNCPFSECINCLSGRGKTRIEVKF